MLRAMLIVFAFPGLAQDPARTTRSGLSFDHPKDWKVAGEKLYGIPTVKLTGPKGSQVLMQVHPRDSNPVGIRIQFERSLLQANEGNLVEGSDQPCKRTFSFGEQDGSAFSFKRAGNDVVTHELYAFKLPGKKELICLIALQHPASAAEAVQKVFAQFAESLTEEGAPRPGAKAAPPAVPAARLIVPLPAGWELHPARQGVKVFQDEFFEFTQLPRELDGGHLLLRPLDDGKIWLNSERVRITRDCTVYLILRNKHRGAVVIPEATLRHMAKDGWREVTGDIQSTSPKGETWGWRVVQRSLKKDDDFPPLRELTLGQPVVFVFK